MKKNLYVDDIKAVRESNDCLFKGIKCDCIKNGKYNTEQNHLIQKNRYLKSIANQNRVMEFNIEKSQYYEADGAMTEVHIGKAYKYRVLCGNHDKLLFNKIENGNKFDENNKEQCFEFAMRAFLFYYSHDDIKSKVYRTKRYIERVASGHKYLAEVALKRFKKSFENDDWDDIESIVIKLNKKVEFISCFYGRPMFDIKKRYIITPSKLSINVFPQDEKTSVIVLSYFKDASKRINKYCNELRKYFEDENKNYIAEEYLSKLLIVEDNCLVMNPLLYQKMNQNKFYKFHRLFKRNSNIFQILKNLLIYKCIKCNCNLFEEV